MSELSSLHPEHPAGHARDMPVRVVLVGETGLDAATRGPGLEAVRVRSALEAIGEVAAPPQSGRRTVVVVGRDAEPNGSLGAFLSAVRSADSGVRVARADAGDEAVHEGYDAVVAPDATSETLRRLVSGERASDGAARTRIPPTVGEGAATSESAEVKPIPVADPAVDAAKVHPTESGDARLGGEGAAESVAEVNAIHRAENVRAGEIDPKPMPGPDARAHGHDAVGDVAMLEALQRSRAVMLDTAMSLMASRLGVHRVVFVAQGTADTGTAPLPSVPVVSKGKRFGAIRLDGDDPLSGEIRAHDLVSQAEWLAAWLSLHDRQQSLRRAAFTDPLTGAWNRRYFDSFLESALTRARDARRTVTVLIFDIDGFKRYNDDFGHPAGDEILIETVRALKSSVRPSDRVCRIGGDEFAVIFDEPEGPRVRGSRPPESVYVLAKRVQRKIGEKKFPKLGDDAPGKLTISGGLAAFPWDGHDAETLLHKADQLACDSKRRGKNAISMGPGAERVCKNEGDEFID